MKFIPVLRIIMLAITVSGLSIKVRAQQLASQKPVSAAYTKNVQAYLASKQENKPYTSSLQNQKKLPSVKPLPRQATATKTKNPQVAQNASLTDDEKIKNLPSKSALTVNQIASRKPAAKNPTLHRSAN